ncbi:MAG TPA: ribonuclease E/G, partial [Stellaceae bacterium]|nr:ribonuclease E/G [Stellaceae bacterium]
GALFIAAGPGEWRAAWAEDGEPRELYVERGDTKPPGSLHLGRIVRLVPGLDAALVDIGDERPAFLPLRQLPENLAAGEGMALVVEVRREAWAYKAPLLTAKLAARNDSVAAATPAAPAQLFPPPGLAAALALRLPGRPRRVTADEAAVVPELRAAFPEAEVAASPATAWPLDLDTLFDDALAPSLALRGGGSVHFDEARAATLIDVDSGTPDDAGAERAALAVNQAAALAIARQLRLRNIGGPAVVDFIGLRRRGSREAVRTALAAALAGDPARPELLGWTRLGHIEIVRPRRGRSLADAMLLPGSRARQPVALAHEALRRLWHEARARPAADWRLIAGPDIAAALRGPAASALQLLETRLGRRIALDIGAGRDGFDIARR